MRRDLAALANTTFDLLVIGGGIHGAAAAWDAVLRGLSVALIEKGDFGGATSQNSLKVIHGGLRYLQDGNPIRIRAMARERSTWMKIAPHLVHPLPCLTPTYNRFSRSRFAMRLALALNDLVSFDRNHGLTEDAKFPDGRILSREEVVRLLPGLDANAISGAAAWQDAQVYNTERLLLTFIESASQKGLVALNYLEALKINRKGDVAVGVRARDNLSGQEMDIHARVTLICTGAWNGTLLAPFSRTTGSTLAATSLALNLVTRKIWDTWAVGLPGKIPGKPGGSQVFFIVPWKNYSIIGTWHLPWRGSPEPFRVRESMLADFLAAVNSAHPALNLDLGDVQHVHWGFLPAVPFENQDGRVRLLREGQVIDHQGLDQIVGLVSLTGVKYTTARLTAERALDLVVQKLGRGHRVSRTAITPLSGAPGSDFQTFLARAVKETPPGFDADVLRHLVYTYGSHYQKILNLCMQDPGLERRISPDTPVIAAEVVRAVREEMAMNLRDVIQRRTELGAGGLPSQAALEACAALVEKELGWDDQRRKTETARLMDAFPIKAIAGNDQKPVSEQIYQP